MGSGSKSTHITYDTAPTVPAGDSETAESGAGMAAPELAQVDTDPVTEVGDADAEGTAEAGSAPKPAGVLEDDAGLATEPESAAPLDGEPTAVVEPPADVVTPIPDAPPEGLPVGVPVLVGGADLTDATATLISYAAPVGGGPREVLLATVEEEAEAKILDALALSEEKLIPVQVEEEVDGRLPVDEDKQLHELVAKAAKSVNHKLKSGAEIPEHTKAYVTAAQTALDTVHHDPGTTSEEAAMAAHYQDQLDAVSQAIATAGTIPYDEEGGKVDFAGPYLSSGSVTVTKMVPAPLADPPPGTLAATIRDATRVHATIDTSTGTTFWDGTSRTPANGVEYQVDLGSGWQAIYRPYSANDPAKHEYSLRGQLEIHAPQGAGHGAELVQRLADLNLVNKPLTHAEGEWTYLKNNIAAQELGSDPQVKAALANASGLEEMQLQETFHAKAAEAVGLDHAGLTALAKSWQLEAAAASLPKQVRLVRDAVAHATGHADGNALAASPGYDPTPRTTGGWLTWTRFDMGNNEKKVAAAWAGKSLVHTVTGGNITALFATGVLASTERRSLMGIGSGVGWSESEDKASGGANSVFTRMQPTPSALGGAQLIWDDPPRLLNRTGIYGYDDDHFGALNSAIKSTEGLTKDPLAMADFSSSSNEIMFHHGLDLLGADAPTRIKCKTKEQKTELLHLFSERGITHLAGKPVIDVVH